MRKLALAIVAAATLLIGSVAPASAHWRHHHWAARASAPDLLSGYLPEHWLLRPRRQSIMDRSMARHPTTTVPDTGWSAIIGRPIPIGTVGSPEGGPGFKRTGPFLRTRRLQRFAEMTLLMCLRPVRHSS